RVGHRSAPLDRSHAGRIWTRLSRPRPQLWPASRGASAPGSRLAPSIMVMVMTMVVMMAMAMIMLMGMIVMMDALRRAAAAGIFAGREGVFFFPGPGIGDAGAARGRCVH